LLRLQTVASAGIANWQLKMFNFQFSISKSLRLCVARQTLRRLTRSPAPTLLTLLTLLTPCLADDKSGVTPNTISVPKGPGAIEGLGESFQPTLNTGTASYGINLSVPPGTAGQAPALKLAYEGGGANGPLGFGWGLPVPCVQRRSDLGIPRYLDSLPLGDPIGRVDMYIDDSKEQLIPQANGDWFCKDEGAFIRYRQVNGHWEGTLPNGTRTDFGLTDAGRIEDPAATNHVFAWLLEQEMDTHGNVITYTYTNFPGSNNLNQKYLAAIAYGPGAPPWNNFHFVTFTYEDRPDWVEDCRSGFIVRTGKRLKQIVAGTQGPALAGHLAGDFNGDGLADYLDREYVLDYLDYAGTNSYWSLLASVTPVGADGTSRLPPATFGYSLCTPPDALSAAGYELDGTNEPPFVMDDPLVDLADLNGDSLPDILKTEAGGGQHTAYLNQGEVDTPSGRYILWSAATNVASADGLAYNVDLQNSTEIAHLADMTGDGAADLVYTAGDGTVYYFENLNSVAWGPRELMSVQDFPPPSPFGSDPNVRTADVDFDKRMDIIQSIDLGGGSVEYRIWFNLGNQTYSPGITVPQNFGFVFSDAGVQIADFNGDRVPDIAQIRPTDVVVTAGLGYGNFADSVSVSIPDYVLSDTQIAQAKLMDITGDGLADLVIERAAPGELWYWVNLGNYTFSTRKVITGMPTGIGVNAVVRWADINGNGTTDLIYADSQSTPHIRAVDVGQLISSNLGPNLLTAISNGIGRVTFVGYASSTTFRLEDAAAGNPWPDPLPFPVQVVSAVTNLDSLGHQYVSQFSYHDGYYDPVEKEFRGFGLAEQIDLGDPTAPTLVSRSFFDTGQSFEAMKGKLLRVTTQQEDGNVFSDAVTTWTIPPVVLMTGTNGTNVSYAHPLARHTDIQELGQGTERTLESEFAYDNYGNQTRLADYGIVVNGDPSAFNDERITVTEYALDPDQWLLRHPQWQETQDYNGTVISRTEYYYDDETFSGSNPGQVSIGNLTLMRSWIDPSNPAAYVTSARSKYDPYGNAVTLLNPLAIAPGGVANLAGGHVRQITYDDLFHTYPVAELIYVGNGSDPLLAQAGYDPGFGTTTRSVDFNQNQTSYNYDVFGRLLQVIKPGDTPDLPTTEYDYFPATPFGANGLINFVETRQLDKAPGSAGPNHRDYYLIGRTFTDGLGRALMTRQEAEPAPGSTAPRVVVTGAVLFNARQKPSRTLNPFFSLQPGSTLDDLLSYESIEDPAWMGQFHENGSLVGLDLAHAHQTSMAYDALLRAIQTTNPDGTFSRTVYEPLVTRGFDENATDPNSPFFNASKVCFSDGLGRLIRTDELTRLNDDGTPAADLKTWTTTYAYDVNGRLTRLTDSQGNVKTLQYDGLERKTSMNDPDRGLTSYAYDDASNVKATVDAKGHQITCTYDGANRILTEDYHDEGLPFSANFAYDPSQPLSRANRPDVAYFYDTPLSGLPLGDGTTATAANTRGMLAYVWDLSGEQHTSYDARGRIAWTVKRIPDQVLNAASVLQDPTSLVSYQTTFQYDSLDRLTTMLYPDNDQVGYEYNARGLLQRIAGGPGGSILSNLVYCPSAQQQQIDCGNGVRTTCAYDNRQRMASLLTVSQASTLNQQIIDFAYTFDGVSNIKAISDQRDTSILSASDPRRNNQTFAYDDLYRLTSVRYNSPAPSSVNGGALNYRYDRIGNLLAQTSDIAQLEQGLPVTDLGTMGYGGAAGPANRLGRQPADPPGPHALSQISNSNSAVTNRVYDYDANGNMTSIDGLRCTWDFKDRLVAAEDDTMRAQYCYDYTDRRITKYVWAGNTNQPATNNPPASTTVYVNRSFEVRDHGQPTKYVFNGATRVAEITGSLSTNLRIQRLRLYPGWNLCSLAVTGPFPASGADGISGVYQWNPATDDYSQVTLGQTVAAGTVLWVKAQSNALVSVLGAYTDPVAPQVQAAGGYVPGAGLEAWSPTLTGSVSAWEFEPGADGWVDHLGGDLAAVSGPPPTLSPGQAFYIKGPVTTDLQIPDPALRIRYYHQDHLGSSGAITDASGALVEETAYFAFGVPRNQYRPRLLDEPYRFTQKERDQESGLHYFEARYLVGALGRFVAADPKYANPESLSQGDFKAFLSNPQQGNLYAYAGNNPVTFLDPTGLGFGDVHLAEGGGAAPADANSEGKDTLWAPTQGDELEAEDYQFRAANSHVPRWAAAVGYGVETVVGTLSCPETGFGCAAMLHGADNFMATITGEPSKTETTIATVTGSEKAGRIGNGVIGVAIGVGSIVTAPGAAASAVPGGAAAEVAWPETMYSTPGASPKTLPGWEPPGGAFNQAAYQVSRANGRAARVAADWKAAVNASPRDAWIQATVDATRDYRYALPLSQQPEAFRLIVETADALFR
jgi:RHS repeat-associated protein